MPSTSASHSSSDLPTADGARTVDDLIERLRQLRAWAGVSYRELHRRVVRERQARGVAEVPAFATVYRCLQPGRERLDVELVVDIVRVLVDDEAETVRWRQAHRVASGRASDADIVAVSSDLPDDVSDFTGRQAELEHLVRLAADRTGGAVVISAIEGMAGVGKTSLAIHAVRLLYAKGFDGRLLSVDLRGFDPDQAPADPAAVLDGFLRQLGVPGHEIHRLDLPARAAKYRSVLSNRRALVLLDNAANEEQLRPLLPDSRSCVVLVTSRRRLSRLANAKHLPLDVLTPDQSLDYMRRSVGKDRVDAEESAAASITAILGHLPLALAMIASRINATPTWSMADHREVLVERVTAAHLEHGVSIALATSYDALAAAERRTLRALSLHPGADFDNYAAAALADIDVAGASAILSDLAGASLLLRRSPGRYVMHDLIRVFAANRTRDMDSPADRRRSLTRLFDHYRYVAYASDNLLAPEQVDVSEAIPQPETPVPTLSDRSSAKRWLDAEADNLLAVAGACAVQGWPQHASDFSRVLEAYLYSTGRYAEAEDLHRGAADITTGPAQGNALRRLATLYGRLGNYTVAVTYGEEAVRLLGGSKDAFGYASAHARLGLTYKQMGSHATAVDHLLIALATSREAGDRFAEGRALSHLGSVYPLIGKPEAALTALNQSLDIALETHDRSSEGMTLDSIGHLQTRQGNCREALDYLERALEVARELHHRPGEASTLIHLGSANIGLGRYDDARRQLETALDIARIDQDRRNQTGALNQLGLVLRDLGRAAESLDRYVEALQLASDIGDRYEEASAHEGLGYAHIDLGNYEPARQHWQVALDLYSELGTPEEVQIGERLATLYSDSA